MKIVFLLAESAITEIAANLAAHVAERASDEKNWGMSAVSVCPFFRTEENQVFGDPKKTPMQFKWAAKRVIKDPREFPLNQSTQVEFLDDPSLMEIRENYGAEEVGPLGWWAVSME